MALTIGDFVQENPPLFGLTVGEALAAIFRRLHPRDTEKHAQRLLDIEPSTAANFVRGKAHTQTITKALRAGNWPLIMALGEAMTGQTYEAFLATLVEEHERARTRAAARQDHVRSLEARAAELVSLRVGPVDGSKRRAAHAVGAREA